MTGPYPGQTYISPGAANPLTGAEIVPLLQSGKNKYTTASQIAALGGGGGGSGSVTQIISGSGLTGGPITSSGTLYVVIGDGLAFSGNAIINTSGSGNVASVFSRTGIVVAVSGDYFSAQVTESGNLYLTSARVSALIPVSSVFSRTGAVVAVSGDYSFAQISSTLNLGTQVTANLPFVNIQSASPSVLLGNPTAVTSTPSQITLGAGIGFSGTTLINLSGAADGVIQVSTGTGLTGGPITSSGALLFASIAPSSLWANVSTATNTPVVTTLAGGLAFSGTTLTTTNLTTGTVGSIATGTGLTGGTITNTGTISFAQIAPSSLWSNVSTATTTPVITTLGGGLAFSGTTIINTSGAVDGVSSVATGTGLTGGTITSTGTISFATISPSSLWANVSTATTTPVITTLGGGLAFSGTTIINTSGAADGVTSITFQSGLSGATITSTGTVGVSNNGITNAMIRQSTASTLVGNPTTATANVQDISIAGNLTFSGTQLTTTNLTTGTVVSVATGAGLTGGTITQTGTISFASIAAASLWANVSTATAVPVITTLGGGLAFSGTTIINTSGAVDGVSSVATGTGLTGGTITSTGAISFATIAASSLWANISTATATPSVVALSSGLAFSGSTLVNAFNSSVAGLTVDGGGSVFTTGSKGYIQIPFNCTISSWTILGNITGSSVVDIKRATYTSFPTATSLVGAGNKPTLAAAQKNSGAPASWSSVTITQADILEFNVDSVSAISRLNLMLNLVRT